MNLCPTAFRETGCLVYQQWRDYWLCVGSGGERWGGWVRLKEGWNWRKSEGEQNVSCNSVVKKPCS